MARKNKKMDKDMRERIVHCVFSEGMTKAATAKRLFLSPSTVRNVVEDFENGKFDLEPRGGVRNKKITQEHVTWLQQQLDDNPGLTIEELRKNLAENFNVHVCTRTVARAVDEVAGYSLKLLHYQPEDFNSPERIAARQQWCQQFMNAGNSMMEAVYIDEAGFNCHLTRKFGRAPRGKRAQVVQPTQKGRNMSVVVAVYRGGILASKVKLGAYNAETFNDFLGEVMDKLENLNLQNRIIILDNVKFHKNEIAKELVDNCGHTLTFLPPYSPMLDAAEWVFLHMKTYVRKQDLSHETLEQHVNASIHRITADQCLGWIREVNRNFSRALQGQALGQMYT